MRIGLRCMEGVEWDNEGDSTHEKSGAVCMEVCCVGFRVVSSSYFAMILFEQIVTIKQRVMNDDV